MRLVVAEAAASTKTRERIFYVIIQWSKGEKEAMVQVIYMCVLCVCVNVKRSVEWMMMLWRTRRFIALLLQVVLLVFVIDQWLYPFLHRQDPLCIYQYHSINTHAQSNPLSSHIQAITTNKIETKWHHFCSIHRKYSFLAFFQDHVGVLVSAFQSSLFKKQKWVDCASFEIHHQSIVPREHGHQVLQQVQFLIPRCHVSTRCKTTSKEYLLLRNGDNKVMFKCVCVK